MRSHHCFFSAAIAALMLSLAACGGHRDDHEIRVTGVELNKTNLKLAVNTQEGLTATVQPTDATNTKVTWQSSNPTIASVDSNGIVKAHKVGSANITVITQDCGDSSHSGNHHSDGHNRHIGGGPHGVHIDNCNGGHTHWANVEVYDPYQPLNVTSIAGIIEKNAQGHSVGNVVLFVNNSSRIEIDGVKSSKGDLAAGMTIEAKGELVNNSQFNCTSISANSILSGNINSIDLASNALIIGETTVAVKEKAIIANFAAGDSIKVFGNFVESDKILATCLLKHGNGGTQATYTAQGVMSNHNSGGKTFQTGKYIVDYSNAKVEGTPVNGAQIVASGPVANNMMYAQNVYCAYYDPNTGVQTGGFCVFGNISNWDPNNYQFQIGNGYGCCSINYLVNYDERTPGMELLSANVAGNLRIEGTLTQSGGRRVIKAAKISK